MLSLFEGLEKSLQAIREFIDYIDEHELGTQLYTSLHEAEDKVSFMHFLSLTTRLRKTDIAVLSV